jgi:MFS family permease
MQAAFLVSAKDFSEKQVGMLFLVFGLSQFLCMAPAGYFLDYSNRKISWVIWAGIICSAITVLTALSAEEGGTNMPLMVVWKVLQGAISAILPCGFNSITLGIVGSTGFTYQVSRNRMMSHVGTAIVVAVGSLIAYVLYPNIGALFVVSPLAALGLYYNLQRIMPAHINRDAARNLITESPTMTEYEQMDDVAVCKQQAAVLNWEADSSDTVSDTGTENSFTKNRVMSATAYNGMTPPPAVTAAPRSHSARQSHSNLHQPYQPPDFLDGLQPPSAQMADTLGALPPSTEVAAESMPQNSPALSDVSLADPRYRGMVESPAAENNNNASDPSIERSTPQSKSTYSSQPSFVFGWGGGSNNNNNNKEGDGTSSTSDASTLSSNEKEKLQQQRLRARTPLAVIMNPRLLNFTVIIFCFHLANSSVLPLVMQSLALRDPQAGILLSGLCVLIAQAFMSFFAKICGDYSPIWGRKGLMIAGLFSLSLRCFLLTILLTAEDSVETERGAHVIKALILSTQFLDSVGAGIIGTLQILVTNDISDGTGRFSLLLGVTTSAMCLGATVSGYLGQALAQDYGYPTAFMVLGFMSLVPFIQYVFFMPETLPDYARPQPKKRRRRLRELMQRFNEQRRRILASKNNPFRRTEPDLSVAIPPSPLRATGDVELV